MAVLSGTTLTGCSFIPDFIASGTIMLFENTSAPTSWTKITTFNDTTCRVISGSISNGGSTAFSSIFTTRSATGGASGSGTATISWNSATSSLTVNPASAASASVQPAVFSTPNHTHLYNVNGSTQRSGGPVLGYPATPLFLESGSVGSGQPHTHGVSFTPQSHTHSLSISPHSHPSLSWPHSHPSASASQNFNLYYVDVILASKN